jgi:hypothetical protein
VQVDVHVNADDQALGRDSRPSAVMILRIVSSTWLPSLQASSLSSALAGPERPLLFICANSLADEELRPLHSAQSPTARQRLGFQIQSRLQSGDLH